jgi:predicted transcriptional regulator
VNKDLYGKYHDVPENILNNLKKYSNEKTIAKILEDKKVSYSNLKKILHDMENGEKKNYKLIGIILRLQKNQKKEQVLKTHF